MSRRNRPYLRGLRKSGTRPGRTPRSRGRRQPASLAGPRASRATHPPLRRGGRSELRRAQRLRCPRRCQQRRSFHPVLARAVEPRRQTRSLAPCGRTRRRMPDQSAQVPHVGVRRSSARPPRPTGWTRNAAASAGMGQRNAILPRRAHRNRPDQTKTCRTRALVHQVPPRPRVRCCTTRLPNRPGVTDCLSGSSWSMT